MADRQEVVRLRLLAAELTAEVARIDRTAAEAYAAREILLGEPERLQVYGAAALLETFYTGVEKALLRVAGALEEVPEGHGWHRDLLQRMTIEVPKLRPPVLAEKTASELEAFLAFRHRFRNLYLFDLRQDLIGGLLIQVSDTWKLTREDLVRFVSILERMADSL